MKVMKHVSTLKVGCKPDKIAKSREDVIDIDGDDFKKSHGFREPCLVRRNRTVQRRQRGSRVGQLNRAGTGKKSLDSKKTLTKKQVVGVEFCPICQYPFRNLVGQSAEWHVDDCLASRGSISNLEECPKGISCTSISQEHFRIYLHTEQASIRSNSGKLENDLTVCANGSDAKTSNIKSTFQTDACTDIIQANYSDCSTDSASTFSSSDSSYERVLSELVDECEDDFRSVSSNCNVGSGKPGMVCVNKTILDTCGYDNLKDFVNKEQGSLDAVKSAITDEKLSVDIAPSVTSGIATESLPVQARKFQQTNLRSYIGVQNAPLTSTSSLDQVQPKNRGIPFTNSGHKARKGQINNVRMENPAPAQTGTWSRRCPFYKKIPGTSITVDAFSYGSISGCTAYFLSHFHYDHYRGLKKTFTKKIYCSQITARLVCGELKVNEKYIHSLPMNQEITVDDVRVTLLDANHCPGSVMFLFLLSNGQAVLHTGDFRADVSMGDLPQLQKIKLDSIYLDTTYCNESYNFPTQQSTIEFAVQKSCEAVKSKPRTLIVCGTYSVGKERVFVSIAKALGSKICARVPKRRILTCLQWPELDNRLTDKWHQAQVHVLPMNKIELGALTKHLAAHKEYQSILAFRPTGWTFKERITDLNEIQPLVSGPITIYGIPYSEHSSFSELEWFIKRFRPVKVIATVASRPYSEMNKLFHKWLHT